MSDSDLTAIPNEPRRSKVRELSLKDIDALGLPRNTLVISPASAKPSRPTRSENKSMDRDEQPDRHAFELALLRVRGRAVAEGRTPTHGEMLKEATQELEEENRRLMAEQAALKAAGED